MMPIVGQDLNRELVTGLNCVFRACKLNGLKPVDRGSIHNRAKRECLGNRPIARVGLYAGGSTVSLWKLRANCNILILDLCLVSR